jgi:hypothetical protein
MLNRSCDGNSSSVSTGLVISLTNLPQFSLSADDQVRQMRAVDPTRRVTSLLPMLRRA